MGENPITKCPIIRGFYVNNRNALPDMPKEMTTFARNQNNKNTIAL